MTGLPQVFALLFICFVGGVALFVTTFIKPEPVFEELESDLAQKRAHYILMGFLQQKLPDKYPITVEDPRIVDYIMHGGFNPLQGAPPGFENPEITKLFEPLSGMSYVFFVNNNPVRNTMVDSACLRTEAIASVSTPGYDIRLEMCGVLT